MPEVVALRVASLALLESAHPVAVPPELIAYVTAPDPDPPDVDIDGDWE